MAGYDTPITVYYCKQTESPNDGNKISPSPSISISPEIYYANDSIVGYTYTISLKGYANALRKDLDAGSTGYGLEPLVGHIGDIRAIFSFNGGNLHIRQGSSDIIVAKGATIKNLNFGESDNNWINYSDFTIDIEFNEVDFQGCEGNPTIPCSGSIFHPDYQTNNKITGDKLIDIKKHKIKEFTDKWTFTVDNQIYENYGDLYNNVFKVSYTLSATGKNYYVDDELIPAWQQAKLFVQDRLYHQINGLIDGICQITNNNQDGCNPSLDISDLYGIATTSQMGFSDGALGGFYTLKDSPDAHVSLPNAPNVPQVRYDIYNETINCETSESNGTFSITYNATLKKNNLVLNPQQNAALHTFTKNYTVSNDQKATISAEGTVQGLVRGGFIYQNNDFELPANGKFISTINGAETKYVNALSYYNNLVGTQTDLLPLFKTRISVDSTELLLPAGTNPFPTSFSLDHNYHEGSIKWSATYDTVQAGNASRGFVNVSITRTDPVEIIQEFVIPGRLEGPIIQKLGMKTARTISISIDGASEANQSCLDINGLVSCGKIPSFSIANFDKLLAENSSWIKTKEDYTTNPIDGSFHIDLEYTSKIT